MKMALDDASALNQIKSYEPGRVRIRGEVFTSSLLVLPNQLFPEWQPAAPAELCAADLELVVAKRPEVLILGTGEAQVFPDPAVFAMLMELGIGFEVMDNAAACRTFNILLAEDRRAALALMFSDD
jgi:uncharacterized protein